MIFYFSGTGNSLYTAEKIADKISKSSGKKHDLCNIACTKPWLFEDDVIGIVCPVYCGGIPKIVEDFIYMSLFKAEYLFVVLTCGGSSMGALNHVSKLMLETKTKIDFLVDIEMSDNSVFMHTKTAEHIQNLDNCLPKIDKIAKQISEHTECHVKPRSNTIPNKIMWFFFNNFYGAKRKKVDKKSCIGCEICKNVCPMQNIKMYENKAVIMNQCQDCFACIHACPEHAIKFGFLRVDDQTVYPMHKLNSKLNSKDKGENN